MGRLLVLLIGMASLLLAGPALAGKDPQPGLFIMPGETVAFKLADGQPVEGHAIGSGDQPQDGEIKASFSADGAMLTVKSNAAAPLNYQAFIAKKAGDKGKRTSVCTLIPGIMAMESWGGGLPGIRLANFTPADDGMICA